jgi:hypothetical protein
MDKTRAPRSRMDSQTGLLINFEAHAVRFTNLLRDPAKGILYPEHFGLEGIRVPELFQGENI